MNNLIISCFLITTFFKLGLSLECYVCEKQDENKEKCIKTLKTCEHYEDMCMTEIAWGITPYWQAGAQKQFYISKSCSTTQQCEKTIKKHMPTCTRIWYEDWKCVECCAGDRCNHYIISGSNCLVPASLLATLLPVILVFIFSSRVFPANIQ